MKSFRIIPHIFDFKKPSGTSRGVMTQKKSWFIELQENGVSAWGECSIIENLSPDYKDDASYFGKIQEFLGQWQNNSLEIAAMNEFPSIKFGIEMALLDLETGGKRILYDTPFTRGEAKIKINGLIWMGSPESMQQQIQEKLNQGFSCIKLKIGAIDWADEYKILKAVREEFSASDIELRVDANGAYSPKQAKEILKQLADLEVHSIEQPIRAGQVQEMTELCATTPCPIALDEELIGVFDIQEKQKLLAQIKPQYIILKPSLHGGISGTQEWISIAKQNNMAWWMTSALESNLGLNAIAQLASTYILQLPQGLGTGALYTTNLPSPLYLEGEWLGYDASKEFKTLF
jgi:o-succinylbenzoate synthase